VVAGFSRYHKYTLGSELRNASREVVGLIIRANSERDKTDKLRVLRTPACPLQVAGLPFTRFPPASAIRIFESVVQYLRNVSSGVSSRPLGSTSCWEDGEWVTAPSVGAALTVLGFGLL
jgi:hypothetical protein